MDPTTGALRLSSLRAHGDSGGDDTLLATEQAGLTHFVRAEVVGLWSHLNPILYPGGDHTRSGCR